VLLQAIVRVSAAVSRTSGRPEKIDHLAALLWQTPPHEVERVVAFLSGVLPGGRTGAGGATVRATQGVSPALSPELTLDDVHRAFTAMADARGGSSRARAAALHQLLSRATAEEQDFLIRLFFGELRQGALESVLIEAVARAAGVPPDRVRRAAILAGALPPVARAVLTRGLSGLDDFSIRALQPIQPMLADSAPDVPTALEAQGSALLEFKLDGARVQVHKADDEIRVFSRSLHDVTQAVPETSQFLTREIGRDGDTV
jgi:DNA ligase-1